MHSSVQTQIFETVGDYRAWRSQLSAQDGRPLLGFVPTMGALHSGHLKLIEQARRECQKVVVSIFVNPLQFGPNEDFGRYPRTFPDDSRMCQEAGVDAIFHPTVEQVYPRPLDQMTKVIPPRQLVERLCGLFRPGHFEGVATVVLKLFEVVQPTNSYFGEKDYQQLAVIRRMVDDLNVPTKIIGVPTVREADGLAKSSRNVYLTEEQRSIAPRLHQALAAAKDAVASGRATPADAIEQAKREVQSVKNFNLQYLEIVDPDSLEPITATQPRFVILIAGKLGDVRLIDNVIAG